VATRRCDSPGPGSYVRRSGRRSFPQSRDCGFLREERRSSRVTIDRGYFAASGSLSGPMKHSRRRLSHRLPISPCGRAFLSLSYSRPRDLPAVPDGVCRRRLLSPACRLPTSAQVERSSRDRAPWVDLRTIVRSPTLRMTTRKGAFAPLPGMSASPTFNSLSTIGSNAEITRMAQRTGRIDSASLRRAGGASLPANPALLQDA